MRLFHERGYEATSLSDILDAAKANSGSLYHFFDSKEDVLLAVLDRYVELLWPAVMTPAFAQTDDPIERVFRVLAGYAQMLRVAEFRLGCPIGNLALEIGERSTEARRRVALNFSNWCDAIRQCLDAAGDRLPADVDRARLARFVLTVMEGGIMQARAHRDLRPYEDAVASLRDYFDRLLSDCERSRPASP